MKTIRSLEDLQKLEKHARGVRIIGVDMTNQHFLGWDFRETEWFGCRGGQFEASWFTGVSMSNCEFYGANFQNVHVVGGLLDHIKFVGSNLSRSYWIGCHFERVEMKQCNLTQVQLSGRALGLAMRQCNVDQADISYSKIQQSVFQIPKVVKHVRGESSFVEVSDHQVAGEVTLLWDVA